MGVRRHHGWLRTGARFVAKAGGLGVGFAAGTALAVTVTASPTAAALAAAVAGALVAGNACGRWLVARTAAPAPLLAGLTELPTEAPAFQKGTASQGNTASHALRDLLVLEHGTETTRGLLKRAATLADNAGSSIERSRRPLSELVSAVGAARQQVAASGEAAGTLDELALTTRLVATKASREAFRAGSAGRELVELAEQLQRLAAQSGEAARRAVVHVDEAVHHTDAVPDLDERARASIADVERQLVTLRTLLGAARQDLQDQAAATRLISERVAWPKDCDNDPVPSLLSRSVADNDNGRYSSMPAPRPSRIPAMNAQALAAMQAPAIANES